VGVLEALHVARFGFFGAFIVGSTNLSAPTRRKQMTQFQLYSQQTFFVAMAEGILRILFRHRSDAELLS
jgi:TRAP-type C4-dicarboxylate transport system permease small subunit